RRVEHGDGGPVSDGSDIQPYIVAPASEDDIRWAAGLAKRVYGGIDVIPESVMLEWYNANPNGFSMIKSEAGECFGNLDVLPLRPTTLSRFTKGNLLERDITGDCLYTPSEAHKITDLYVE